MTIRFTQYLRPDGRRRDTWIDRGDATEAKADALRSAGYRLEAEVLMTGEVSFSVYDPEEDVDVVVEVVPNGPKVPGAVDRLIERGYEALLT